MTKKIFAAAVAAVLISTGAAEAKPRALKGTVVHKNHKSRSVVVAGNNGVMRKVRARRGKARFAHHVAFRGTRTRTGWFTTRHLNDDGAAQTAKVRGAVTFVDEAARTFTVSDNGASILVHLADTTKALPAVGDTVLVLADLATSTATQLEATNVVVNPAAAADKPIEIEGIVLAVDSAKRVVTLSADEEHESGEMIAVTIPAELDLARFTVGKEVELLATLNDDGETFTATAIDDHNCGDDDFRDHDRGDDDDQGEDRRGDDDGDDDRGDDDRRGSNRGDDDGDDDRSGRDHPEDD